MKCKMFEHAKYLPQCEKTANKKSNYCDNHHCSTPGCKNGKEFEKKRTTGKRWDTKWSISYYDICCECNERKATSKYVFVENGRVIHF